MTETPKIDVLVLCVCGVSRVALLGSLGSVMNHPFQLAPSQRAMRSIIAMVAFEKEVNSASPFSAVA